MMKLEEKALIAMNPHGKKNLDGYDYLAIAICERAAADYRHELKLSKKRGEKTFGAFSIERFFLEEWGDMLSYGQGRRIIEKIKKECGWVD